MCYLTIGATGVADGIRRQFAVADMAGGLLEHPQRVLHFAREAR
jgi:hypothetical protein